jgi:hypothetical protein
VSWDADGKVQAALAIIVADPAHGPAALSDARQMSSLLEALLPDSPRERALLEAAAREGVAGYLQRRVSQGLDVALATQLIAAAFAQRAGCAPDAGEWVVRELAAALGLRTSATAQAQAGGDGSGGTRRHGNATKIAAAAAAVIVIAAAATVAAGLQGPSARVLSGGNYGFSGAYAIAVDGAHVWVANGNVNSVTELSARDGSRVRTLSGGRYGFDMPYAIAVGGAHVWVVNEPGYASDPGNRRGSVTELNASDGSWIRTISGPGYGLTEPSAIAVDGAHLWVVNSAPAADAGTGGSVTELNASNGSWVRTVSGGRYGFDVPCAIAADGAHLWVTNCYTAQTGGSVTELDASDGSPVQTLSSSNGIGALLSGTWARSLLRGGYGFSNPGAIAVDGPRIWVASYNSLTVLTSG